MFVYRNDSACNAYQRYADSSLEWLQKFVRDFSGSAFPSREAEQHYAIVFGETDEMIGDLTLFFSEKDHCFTLGITVAPPRQRQGFAYELLQEVIAQLQSFDPAADLVALVDRDNAKSIALFQKLHFIEECYAESIRSHVFVIYGKDR